MKKRKGTIKKEKKKKRKKTKKQKKNIRKKELCDLLDQEKSTP